MMDVSFSGKTPLAGISSISNSTACSLSIHNVESCIHTSFSFLSGWEKILNPFSVGKNGSYRNPEGKNRILVAVKK